TGIRGLDSILGGSIHRPRIILLEGVTGTGKTLMGMEFIYRGITEFNEPGIIVVFETTPDKLIRDAATFGWKLDELQEQKRLKIIFTAPEVFEEEMRSPGSLLMETAIEMGAHRIFIDGVSLLAQIAKRDSFGHGSFREILQQLVEELNRENLTAALSHESGTTVGSVS